MSIEKIYSVFCETCPMWVAQTGDGAKAARKWAKDAGWVRVRVDGKLKDCCPSCQRAATDANATIAGVRTELEARKA